MNEIGLSYIAGYLDGEGSIFMTVAFTKTSTGVKRPYHKLIVRIANCYLPTLEDIQREFGGSVTRVNKNKTPCFQLSIYCQQALSFLTQILPYLKQKREEAELAIKYQSELKELTFDQREKIRMKLHSLKGNGTLLPIKDYRYSPKSNKYHDNTDLNPYK